MKNRTPVCLLLLSAALALIAIPCSFAEEQPPSRLTPFVDPLVGSDAHGHVFVGASVPFGAVQLGLTNFHQGWDWCSGYHFSDDVAVGFSHLHLSGTGIPDLGDIVIAPFVGEVSVERGSHEAPEPGYASRYSHDQETAKAGYYAVTLLDDGIRAELTATERVGWHRYTFPAGVIPRIALDLEFENGNGRAVDTGMRVIDADKVEGRRFSTGWAKDQRVFFALQASEPIASVELFGKGERISESDGGAKNNPDVAVMTFAEGVRTILLKVGVSPVSEEGAMANIRAEAPGWDFDAAAAAADSAWENALSRVRFDSSDQSQVRTFYTALYHTMIAPVLYNDASGDYLGADKEVRREAGHENYSIFSLWDTYRAAHPLLTLTQPQRVPQMVNSMLAINRQQGKLPVWHLLGNETDTMVGYHAVPVIVDAILKGFEGIDAEEAFAAVKATAMRDERGLKFIKERGYIPADAMRESVALAMEYAIDDWAIAQLARRLGQQEDYDYFLERSQHFRKYFDEETGFMRGKRSDGSWNAPFDPFFSKHRADDYCEGNAWQYLWLVPHDPEALIELLGGAERFATRLDELFEQAPTKNAEASLDMSGFIGQYVHGNEPSHHIAYLYPYAGQQWKTAERVRQIMDRMYSDQPDGLCGNEDCGQMSAWYVFSAMGFYPVDPVGGQYVLGSPIADRVTIELDGGESFRVVANNNTPSNVYLQSAVLNGKPLEGPFLSHREIVSGGELVLEMGPEPNRTLWHAAMARAHRPDRRN
ncbi:Glycosyl hydrolase family 92 [Posidoniimonas polymericola]|uniref:Glycosyl hydrolase family 92 n=1 Tax=Posidoniimonas polymericola TaxID=2528002 RepID=A0A5C5YTP8_9BACT|nr:GH92 family glycosyl hydrolase [Posidoniimonas polymericola]TWT78369.1 Glycosyl hydrolase family 92 [Posidoniimonas polymericola]